MSESFERFPEFPSEEQIVNWVAEYLQGREYKEERRNHEDGKITLIEWSTVDNEGDLMTVIYQRGGLIYDFRNRSKNTAIRAVYYVGDTPVGGDTLVEFVNGRWRSREG